MPRTPGTGASSRLARILSHALNPLVLGFPLLLGMALAEGVDWRRILPAIVVVFGLSMAVPMLYALALFRFRLTDDVFITKRSQRALFLPLLLTCLAGVVVVAHRSGAPARVLAATLGLGLSILAAALATLRWKVSLHMTGVASLASGFLCFYGAAALPMLALVGATAWARLVVGEHSLAEVLAGTLLGGGVTAAVVTLLL